MTLQIVSGKHLFGEKWPLICLRPFNICTMSHNYPAKLSYLPRIVRKHQTPVAALCSDFSVGRACIQYFHCAVVSHAEKQDDGSFLFIVNIFFPLVFVSCHYPGICFVKCTGQLSFNSQEFLLFLFFFGAVTLWKKGWNKLCKMTLRTLRQRHFSGLQSLSFSLQRNFELQAVCQQMNDVNYMQSVCDNVGINYLLDLHKNSHELFLFRIQPGSRRFKGCSCVSCSTHWCKMTLPTCCNQSVCLQIIPVSLVNLERV